MAGNFHHEALYRGADNLTRLAGLRLTLCGAGALGSHLADNLARQGSLLLKVIDRDRVEEHNVSTQLYAESEVGAWKVEVLRQRLFRAAGIEIDAVRKELTERSARGLLQCPCLHVGLHADYGEVIWDEHYRVPQDVAGDVCAYPLARNLVLLVVAIASEVVLRFALESARQSWSATLRDFAVRPLETS